MMKATTTKEKQQQKTEANTKAIAAMFGHSIEDEYPDATPELIAKFKAVAAADRDEHTPEYNSTEVDRALNGYTREIIQIALKHISSTQDLTLFLDELTAIHGIHASKWIEKEQFSIANGLF